MESKLNIACLISGSGTTLQNLINLQRKGTLPIDIKLVISSRPDAKGLQRAQSAGIPTQVVSRSLFHASRDADPESADSFSKQISDAVRSAGVDLVCMGGFLSMWIIPPDFEGRVMNIHPALLPLFGGKGFYGELVYRAVLDAGCKVTGCTVHFVDNSYDHGPIVLQKPVLVRENDTVESLGRRVRFAERKLYPHAIRLFSEGRLQIDGRRVRILDHPPQ